MDTLGGPEEAASIDAFSVCGNGDDLGGVSFVRCRFCSSCTAELIKVDAELKMDDPKPNIFPPSDSAGFAVSC